MGSRDCISKQSKSIWYFEKKELLLVVFVDFEAVYDRIIVGIFVEKLKN